VLLTVIYNLLDLSLQKIYYVVAIGGFYMEFGMFEQLEQKVEKIIERCGELTKENEKLTEMLRSKEEETESLTRKLEKLGKEKGLVREKVETLLERLEGLIQTT